MTKSSVCRALYLRNQTSYNIYLWHTCVKGKYLPSGFFYIFPIFNIQGCQQGVKGHKVTQNDKKFCQLHSISQEAYIILSWFLLQMCKMMTSPEAFFFFFKILIFWVVRGVKGQKMAQSDKKFCLSHFVSQELYLI